MKNFIIMSGTVRKTVVARLQAMKSDWKNLALNERMTYVNRLLNGYSVSDTQKQAIYAFLRDVDQQQKKLTLNCKELICTDFGNSLEFQVIEVSETYPTIREVTDEEYNRFSEDAEDELTK